MTTRHPLVSRRPATSEPHPRPRLRVIDHWHDHPGYLDAVALSPPADGDLSAAVDELIGELHNRVGAARRGVAVVAEQSGTAQAGFAGQNLDTVAAKSLLDALAVEQYGFRRARAEHGRKYAGREMGVSHRWGYR